jgi:hypothetical protein
LGSKDTHFPGIKREERHTVLREQQLERAHRLCLSGPLSIKGEAVGREGIQEDLHNAPLKSVKFLLPDLTDGDVVR